MKPKDATKEQFIAELAKYGKTIEDWFKAFPITTTDFVYHTSSIEDVAKVRGWTKLDNICPSCTGCIAFLPWEADYNYGDIPQVYRHTCATCGTETWFIPNRCPVNREDCPPKCPEFTFKMFE